MSTTFEKYRARGAYHWRAFSKNPARLDLFTRARYQAVLDLVERPEGGSLVDIGCGDGALTWLLAREGRHGTTVGVEPETVGRELAEKHCAEMSEQVRFLADSALVRDASADVVVCSEVIEHVDSPDKLLSEITRILKPGGRLVVSTPVRLTERPFDKEHVQEFFPSEFAACVGKHLAVEKHTMSISVFAVGLYNWCPAIFLRRGVIKLLINAIYSLFGWNFLTAVKSGNGYWITQLIVARKSAS